MASPSTSQLTIVLRTPRLGSDASGHRSPYEDTIELLPPLARTPLARRLCTNPDHRPAACMILNACKRIEGRAGPVYFDKACHRRCPLVGNAR